MRRACQLYSVPQPPAPKTRTAGNPAFPSCTKEHRGSLVALQCVRSRSFAFILDQNLIVDGPDTVRFPRHPHGAVASLYAADSARQCHGPFVSSYTNIKDTDHGIRGIPAFYLGRYR